MKKFRTLASILTILCVAGTTAFAADQSQDISLDTPDSLVVNETTAVLVEDGIPRLISAEEAERLLNESKELQETGVPGQSASDTLTIANEYTYRFTPTSSSTALDYTSRKKVTPDIMGPATINYGSTYSFTRTFSGNISITTPIKSAVSASIGAAVTASNSSSFGVTYKVDSGKSGYVQFTPKIKTTYGSLKVTSDDHVIQTTNLNAKDPVKVGQFCDGLYQLITA